MTDSRAKNYQQVAALTKLPFLPPEKWDRKWSSLIN